MRLPHLPHWLNGLAVASLVLAASCTLIVIADLARRPQPMGVMNLVWPLTMTFGGPVWLYFYLRHGRAPDRGRAMWVAVAKSTSHCGAGCVLGDIVAEWACFRMPAIAAWCGWGSLFRRKMFAIWVPDLLLAFLFGIAFQYFAIAAMRRMPPGKAVVAAIKADTASILAWQIGMYGCMAAIQLLWVEPAYGAVAPVDGVAFWFFMQIAMLCGFATSFPVNWLLVRAKVKEKM